MTDNGASQALLPHGPWQTSRETWLAAQIRPQRAYRRVWVVGGPPARALPRRFPLLGKQVKSGPIDPTPLANVQEALKRAQCGDLILVTPGKYPGFRVGPKPRCRQGAYLHLRAFGPPGSVRIEGPPPRGIDDWAIHLETAHHVIIEGFSIPKVAAGPSRAAFLVDGNFRHTGKLAHHIVILNNYAFGHRRWGFHSTDSHTVALLDNVFAHSVEEHGAYASDGSDNYLIAGNGFYNNAKAGLQCNLDVVASVEEATAHRRLEHLLPVMHTPEWLARFHKEATAIFGKRGYPDGKGEGFVIEHNIATGNGARGGGAFNFASMSESVVRYNLIYGNLAHGLAQWDDRNPWDRKLRTPGPKSLAHAKDPSHLAGYGCQNNRIEHNTILISAPLRAGLQAIHGSFGGKLRCNFVLNGQGAALELGHDSLLALFLVGNIVSSIELRGKLKQPRLLAPTLPFIGKRPDGASASELVKMFQNPSEKAWINLRGIWPKQNPARPDFRPRPGALAAQQQGCRSSAGEGEVGYAGAYSPSGRKGAAP